MADEHEGHEGKRGDAGRSYLDGKGRVLFVGEGLGGSWGTYWRSEKGSLHRVVSKGLPVRRKRELAQGDLDAWARVKKLREAGSDD
jgi:hypothetical protein